MYTNTNKSIRFIIEQTSKQKYDPTETDTISTQVYLKKTPTQAYEQSLSVPFFVLISNVLPISGYCARGESQRGCYFTVARILITNKLPPIYILRDDDDDDDNSHVFYKLLRANNKDTLPFFTRTKQTQTQLHIQRLQSSHAQHYTVTPQQYYWLFIQTYVIHLCYKYKYFDFLPRHTHTHTSATRNG